MDKKHSTSVMEMAELKSFAKPDEVREFPKGKVELIRIGGPQSAGLFLSPGGSGQHL